jgi:hypothetical protein
MNNTVVILRPVVQAVQSYRTRTTDILLYVPY